MLDFIFPKRCLGCGRIGAYFCSNCRNRIIFIERSICPVCEKAAIDGATHPGCRTRYTMDGLTSFFRYDGIVRYAIKAVKYRLVTDLASEFISLIPSYSFLSKLLSTKPLSSLLIPIPLHPSRFRERGFNQAEKLAQFIAPKLEMPLADNLLYRIVKRKPQADITFKKQRIENAKGIFQLATSMLPEKVLLFDDVWTTGATMKEATRVLKKAEVKWVWGLTLAR